MLEAKLGLFPKGVPDPVLNSAEVEVDVYVSCFRVEDVAGRRGDFEATMRFGNDEVDPPFLHGIRIGPERTLLDCMFEPETNEANVSPIARIRRGAPPTEVARGL